MRSDWCSARWTDATSLSFALSCRRRARGARDPRLRRDALRACVLRCGSRWASSSGSTSPLGRPWFSASYVFDSPEQQFTWTGFATFVTVACGSSRSSREHRGFLSYTPTRRDMRIGLGAVAACDRSHDARRRLGRGCTGDVNPFVAVSQLTSSDALLVVLAVATSRLAANITNIYTAGLSLVNSAPRLGRPRDRDRGRDRRCALGLSRLRRRPPNAGSRTSGTSRRRSWGWSSPTTSWCTGRGSTSLRARPNGRYRYLNGVNVAALCAVVIGVVVYYAVPQAWLKVRGARGSAPEPTSCSAAGTWCSKMCAAPRRDGRAAARGGGGRAGGQLIRPPTAVDGTWRRVVYTRLPLSGVTTYGVARPPAASDV